MIVVLLASVCLLVVEYLLGKGMPLEPGRCIEGFSAQKGTRGMDMD